MVYWIKLYGYLIVAVIQINTICYSMEPLGANIVFNQIKMIKEIVCIYKQNEAIDYFWRKHWHRGVFSHMANDNNKAFIIPKDIMYVSKLSNHPKN